MKSSRTQEEKEQHFDFHPYDIGSPIWRDVRGTIVVCIHGSNRYDGRWHIFSPSDPKRTLCGKSVASPPTFIQRQPECLACISKRSKSLYLDSLL